MDIEQYLRENYGKLTYKEMGEYLGKPSHTVRYECQKLGLKSERGKHPLSVNRINHKGYLKRTDIDVWSDEEIKYLKDNYQKKSLKEISRNLGRSYNAVRTYLRKTGYRISVRDRRNKCNDNYFSDLNLESAYWAGFIAADGNIHSKKPLLTITLAKKDKEHLKKFKKSIKFEGNIIEGVSRGKYPYCSIAVHSERLCDDLAKYYNIIPRKSLILQPPNIKNKELIDAFIVGYIDGDGSIGRYKFKKCKSKILQISFIGTLEICEWIQNRFSEIVGYNISRVYSRGKGKNQYQFMCSGQMAIDIWQHFSSINVPSLERKWSLK